MFRRSNILLPTDFSANAMHAMKYAVALAKKFDATVRILHVVDESIVSSGHGRGLWLAKTDSDALLASMKAHADSRLSHLKQVVEDDGVNVSVHSTTGRPDEQILRFAEDNVCSPIILSTHGRSGFDHLVFGSVAERVVRQSPVPVLAIKHPEHEFVKDDDLSLVIKRILFPTDFSPFSEKALPFAVSLCKEFGAQLVLLHASELAVAMPEFMPDAALSMTIDLEESARQALEHVREGIEGIDVATVSVTGAPHREICRVVEESLIDLVVMPTHGRSGLIHMLFGSVTEKVVRLAHCPVLTIRPEWPGKA